MSREYIVISPYYNSIDISIGTYQSKDDAMDENDNNFITPIVMDLKEFQKKYKVALENKK